ncbi:glycogen debranching N-terminal domain-containing protein [Bosea sp. (in: a-proteobacteria)]|uniref:amylo-alpha-1,6-glucosidase n=1 Tax=Bosea sp. (in: a-proteobacteria) TaxID=1871050 RepID=UPI002629C2FD|nr:glycogen debranching N-terminal domain-containing protein [Bosea sp. (in: a-proteobacteria)]MCO5091195.1 amylo-alpha-1,6-glucosidase [Bosea sp. (in: a-proteobacteria)]
MSESISRTTPPAPAPDSRNLWSEYEIEATTSLTEHALRNLKHGDAFAVLDAHGDIGTRSETAEGLFFRDTRFLSHLELRVEGKRPLLLSSAVHEDKAVLSVELTNPDLRIGGDKLARDTLFLQRTKFLWQAICYERISVRNYGAKRLRLHLDLLLAADFHDMFEVRGTRRLRRGTGSARVVAPNRVVFRYVGLDRIERRTLVAMNPPPVAIDRHRMTAEIDLGPCEQRSLFLTVSCLDAGVGAAPPMDFLAAYRDTRRARRAATSRIAAVKSSNTLFDATLGRAISDVYTLVTRSELGPYPYAGIPWFNTVFGRDGIITAMLMLWIDPDIARGVLRTLAATQAQATDPEADAQPGKILHEMRHGEMARLHEVPFGRYYGTIDATPLFVMLAGLYLRRTGDVATIRAIWPNIRAALGWMDAYGDRDGDGFIEYARARESGLANQGWKDSHDAVFHADGSDPVGPIALCEVQAYAYAAKLEAAAMARGLGDQALASALDEAAERLRIAFERAFWCADLGTYALALDGEKRPCRVPSSNAGHALFAGIASPERARSVATNLLTPEAFSGWGIRTLPAGQPRYNPMSYHNGSVWPHDNALIAIGLTRYGLKTEASRVFSAIFETGRHQDMYRLPELFCGFNRRPHRAPVPYPVACAPQAWSAASILGLLGACLGLDLDHGQDEIRFHEPVMPDFLDELVIRNLRLGASVADIRFHRYGRDVTANVLSRSGSARIILSK